MRVEKEITCTTGKGTKVQVMYTYIEKMTEKIAWADGDEISLGTTPFVSERFTLVWTDTQKRVMPGYLDTFPENSTENIRQLCKQSGTNKYFRTSMGGILLPAKEIERVEEMMESARHEAKDETVQEYLRKAAEQKEAHMKSRARGILKKAEKTIRNKDGHLMTLKEAAAWKKSYNDLWNEGGEGFVPEIITKEDVEWAEKILGEESKS